MRKLLFKPGVASSIITLILLPIFLSLGFWQLSRAENKQKLINQCDARLSQPPISLEKVFHKDYKDLRFTHVTATGQFLENKHILLDNQIHNHQVGYVVLSPFKTDFDKIILVNTGWVPAHSNRKNLPNINAVNHIVTVDGFINILSSGILLKNTFEDFKDLGLIRIQKVEFNLLSVLLKNELLAYTIQSTPPFLGTLPTKHISYAIQWFSFALVLVLYYLYINVRRSKEIL